jgi:hypothetical protein
MNNAQMWRRLAFTHLHRYGTNYISEFYDIHETITGNGVDSQRHAKGALPTCRDGGGKAAGKTVPQKAQDGMGEVQLG